MTENMKQNYIITPDQANINKYYLKALEEEIFLGEAITSDDLRKNRINHPEILKYKARILGKQDRTIDYADWIQFVIDIYKPRKSCLSLGSGLGRVEKYLVDHGFTEHIETIELCADVNTKNRFHKKEIDVIKGDLNFVNLKQNKYDFILCHGVLHHLINLEHILNEINEALTKDGIFFVYEYVGETRWQFSQKRIDLLKSLFPDILLSPPPRWKIGGFESVRSGDLLQLIKECFGDPYGHSATYGGVYFPFVICTKPKEDVQIEKVIELDEEFSKSAKITPCYHMGIYKKSTNKLIPPQKWSDEMMKYYLDPQRPIVSKIYREAKLSRLGKYLRKIKGNAFGAFRI